VAEKCHESQHAGYQLTMQIFEPFAYRICPKDSCYTFLADMIYKTYEDDSYVF